MRGLSLALILVAAAVNLFPAAGAFSSAARLQAFYGVSLEDPNLVVLMRHRAVLFAIVGGLLVAGAFHAPLRTTACVAGLVSMLSFVALAGLAGGANAELRRVLAIDLVASILLVAAAVLDHLARARGAPAA